MRSEVFCPLPLLTWVEWGSLSRAETEEAPPEECGEGVPAPSFKTAEEEEDGDGCFLAIVW